MYNDPILTKVFNKESHRKNEVITVRREKVTDQLKFPHTTFEIESEYETLEVKIRLTNRKESAVQVDIRTYNRRTNRTTSSGFSLPAELTQLFLESFKHYADQPAT